MSPPRDVIRVLIVDDHALYRRGLQTVLAVEEGIEVVAEAADGVEAVRQAEGTLPTSSSWTSACPSAEASTPAASSSSASPRRSSSCSTSSDDDTDLFEAIRAGANGYLLKDATEDIAAGIRGVIDGQSLLSPVMATELLLEFKQISQRAPTLPANPGLEQPHLTQRELDILQRVAQGRRNREIAAELVISENTVRNHIRNILDKLQMHSRMEAALYAIRQKLIDPGN